MFICTKPADFSICFKIIVKYQIVIFIYFVIEALSAGDQI